jgi:hypothetical protein
VIDVDAIDAGLAPLLEVAGDLVRRTDDPVCPLQHEGEVVDGRFGTA